MSTLVTELVKLWGVLAHTMRYITAIADVAMHGTQRRSSMTITEVRQAAGHPATEQPTQQPATEHPVVDAMKSGGGWNHLWDGLYEMDPDWTEQYMAMAMATFQSGIIDPKVVQMLCIAVDASATHMYAPGTRRHIQAALDMGVTPEEVLEVLKLATTVGIHSCNIGVPILTEEMAARGLLPQAAAAQSAPRAAS